MKSPAITLSLVLIVFAGLFFWGSSGRGGASASLPGAPAGRTVASVLSASEPFYDFGTISMKDGNVTREFVVTNPTDRDVTIAAIVTSCMCTEAFLVRSDGSMKGPFGMEGMGYIPPANETLQAGESRTIRVVYDPNAHGPAGVGRIDRFVTLTDKAGGTLPLEIVANVTP